MTQNATYVGGEGNRYTFEGDLSASLADVHVGETVALTIEQPGEDASQDYDEAAPGLSRWLLAPPA